MIYFGITHCELIRCQIAIALERHGRPAAADRLTTLIHAMEAFANRKLAREEDLEDLKRELDLFDAGEAFRIQGFRLRRKPIEAPWRETVLFRVVDAMNFVLAGER